MLAALRRARYGDLLALHILLLCAAGRLPTAIAAGLCCSRSSVSRTVHADRAGPWGLERDAQGPFLPPVRTTVLAPTLRRALVARPQAGPRVYGGWRTRWSCATLAATLQAKRGIRGSAQTMRRWLHELDWVGKRATRVAKEDDHSGWTAWPGSASSPSRCGGGRRWCVPTNSLFLFENLIANLFERMELETKLTRSHRDGGVDVVAFDTRPVLGGKVVIQAKRYKNAVGVSAVRDLYGTMLNEGANKGILVTTSGYGPDAFEFAKDKPIELMDGGQLLYLLEQVGVKARIVFPEEGA
jgi:transposase